MTKNEKREVPPVPIDWLQKTMLHLVCGPDRKFSSEDTVIVFTLIDLWRKRMNRVLSRKTWHEVIDDEQAYVLADYGVRNIILTCVEASCEPAVDNYEAFCRKIVNKSRIPDEFSYNEVLTILDDYLHIRWEEYNHG